MNVAKEILQGPQRKSLVKLSNLPPVFDNPMRRLRRFAFPIYCKLMAMQWHLDTGVTWASTDGRGLFLNPAAFNWLYAGGHENPEGVTAWILGHEGWHGLNDHPQRLSPAKAPDRKRANISADHVTNLALNDINHQAGRVYANEFPLCAPEGLYMDDAFLGMSVEEVYNEIGPQGGGGTGGTTGTSTQETPDGNPSPTSGKGGADVNDQGTTSGDARGGDDGEANEDGGVTSGGGGQSKQGQQAGDDPTSGSGNQDTGNDDTEQGAGSTNRDASNYGFEGVAGTEDSDDLREAQADDGKTKAEVEQEIKEQNKYIIINQQMNEKAGLAGDTFGRLIQAEQKTPPVDWREHYRNWLNARAASGWDKPVNIPVFTSTGLVCAGREQNIIEELVIGIDVSGSVDDRDLSDMYHKTIAVLDEVKFITAHIVLCDYEIRKVVTVENNSTEELRGILDGVGGGGTAFIPYFEWASEHAPNAPIIIMTDGECDDLYYLEDPNVPLLWLSWAEPVESYKVGEAIKIWN